ncbi:LacI family DNA-binding transcriptional regulator [Micrococcaceae bacterium Sec5.7]
MQADSGQRRAPVMTDVARLAGVSHQTVSRVINNHPNVSARTRRRVETAIAGLGYRRNIAARALVTRKSTTVGVIGVESAQFGPANTLIGVQNAARAAGYFVSVAGLASPTLNAVQDAVGHLLDQGVDGIVVIAPHAAVFDELLLLDLPVPLVTIGDPAYSSLTARPSGHAVVSVGVDQELGAWRAVRHLIELGHEQIAHLAGPPDWIDATARQAGWRRALRGANLPVTDPYEGDWSAASGYRLGPKILAASAATAVFVANDQMSIGLLCALHEAAIRVPEDVSVVGFDDLPEAGYALPPLTTVRQDFQELGRRCIAVLLERVNGTAVPAPPPVQPELIRRSSAARRTSSSTRNH